jgi:hypothetical protein
MKSLLFIGATLMVGAGIYGFVDFKKKNQSREFKTLYKEEKPVVQQPSPEVITSPVATTATEKKEIVVEAENAAGNKTVKRKFKSLPPKAFSRAIPKEEAIEEMVVPAEEEQAPLKKEL